VLQAMRACPQAASGVLFLALLAQELQLLEFQVLQVEVVVEEAQSPEADHQLLEVAQRDPRRSDLPKPQVRVHDGHVQRHAWPSNPPLTSAFNS